MATVELLAECWCTWSPTDGRTHEAHVEAHEYPDHEPAAEWNVDEPPAGWTPPERHWGFA